MEGFELLPSIVLLVIAFFQNVSYVQVFRVMTTSHNMYHLTVSTISTSLWFATLGFLFHAGFSWWLFIPYLVGTVAGSLFGHDIARYFERFFKIKVDRKV